MRRRIWSMAVALSLTAGLPHAAGAAPITFSDESAFRAALSGTATTYDFEAASGFPTDTNGDAMGGKVFVGLHDDVHFDAAVTAYPHTTSGTQALTWAGDMFGDDAIIDFSALDVLPSGVGFYGLDLTSDEIVRMQVKYAGDDGSFFYSASLAPTQSDFTPIFFGVVDTAASIEWVRIFGRRDGDFSAWLIDDLTRDGSVVESAAPVPEPASLLLLGTGLAGVVLARRRRTR